MSPSRSLPTERNAHLEEGNAPEYDELIALRCLGSTELKVKPGQVGTTNATKPANLGILDYAHLRVPLPSDLDRSGIFQKGRDRAHPEAYFLMRRSSDGFVSATGMYKAAFPYSSVEDEATEKEYIKTLPAASTEEVAGNVWIHPDEALILAQEYGIKHWIVALLDPAPIVHGTEDKPGVMSPPPYRVKDQLNGTKSPKAEKKSVRGRRNAKSASPAPEDTKTAARKIATPRKPRKGRKAADEESVNGDTKPDTVTVEVETTKSPNGDEETTKVNIEMPANSPDLALPHDAEGMLEKAREMVAEAEKLGLKSGKSKRKAKDLTQDDDVEEPLPAKKARMELEQRKEKIKRRALTSIAVSLTVGALVPTALTFMGWS